MICQLLINLIDQPNITDKPKQHELQVGDFVPDERNFYRKGYKANVIGELLKIPKLIRTNSRPSVSEDQNNKQIEVNIQ